MKHLILILTLFTALSISAQISYNPARKLVYVRTLATPGKKPPLSQVPEGTWGYCSGDSTLYKSLNGEVVPFARMYTKSGTKKIVHADVSGATTQNFSGTKKMYYVLYDSVAGNLPILADFPTGIYQAINTRDSLWYDKYNGLVRAAKVFYYYNQPTAPYYPTLDSRIYVSTTGNDASTNPHNPATPYKTVYNACLHAGSYDTIRIMAGSYTESKMCSVPETVSIQGAGKDSTFIIGRYAVVGSSTLTGATLSLTSSTVNTNGNQAIFDLTLDGDNLTGSRGIAVKNRSNVKLHDLIVKNFYIGGVNFHANGIFVEAMPATYERGNELYNCTITNCGDAHSTWNGNGLILVACQDSILIHDNILSAVGRSPGYNGNIINAGGRHFKNFKYYNNKSYKSDYEAKAWNFHLEFWDIEGGMEIYDNEFYGGDCYLDLGGSRCIANGLVYSAKVYNNFARPNNGHGLPKSYHPRTAITIESFDTKDIEIYDNHFKNWPSIFSIEDAPYTACDVRRVSFHHNLCENVGWGNGVSFVVNQIQVERVGNYMSDISIYNNTIVGDNTGSNTCFDISIGSRSGNEPIPGGTMERIDIYNNIMCYNRNRGPIYVTNNGVLNDLTIGNNLSYNLLNYNVMPLFWLYSSGTISGYVFEYNIPVSNTTQQDPLLLSTFHLNTGSPAINAGRGGVNIGKY